MNLNDLLSVSFRFIRIRFLESLMVVFGLALGVAIIASLFSLVGAYNHEMNQRANNPEQREIRVESNTEGRPIPGRQSPAIKIGNTQEKHIMLSFVDLVKARKACPDVKDSYVSFDKRFSVANTSDQNRAKIKDLDCKMVSPEYFTAYNMEIAAGSIFTESDIHSANSVIVLDKKLAAKLFPDENNSSIIGKNITLSSPDSGVNLTFTVIGILKYRNTGFTAAGPAGNGGNAYCPYTLSLQYRSQKGLNALSFSVADIKNLKKAVYQLNNYFSGIYGKNSIRIHSALDWEKDQRRIIIPIFSIITFFVGAGLLMAAMNILNLMLARIARQKKNIGIMMAIGASRFDIFKLFLAESLTLGIMGGGIGCFIAFLLSWLLQLLLNPDGVGGGGPQMDVIRGAGPQINVTFSIMAVALLLTLILNTVFGIYPAYKASRIEPADALRSD